MTVDPSFIYSDRIRRVCDGLVSLLLDAMHEPFDWETFVILVNNSEIDWETDGPALLLHMGATCSASLDTLANEGGVDVHALWQQFSDMKREGPGDLFQ
ncbi:MAG: hypothetical protein ACWGQW_02285 [bacterium]